MRRTLAFFVTLMHLRHKVTWLGKFDTLQSRTPKEYYSIHIPFPAKPVASEGVEQTTRML